MPLPRKNTKLREDMDRHMVARSQQEEDKLKNLAILRDFGGHSLEKFGLTEEQLENCSAEERLRKLLELSRSGVSGMEQLEQSRAAAQLHALQHAYAPKEIAALYTEQDGSVVMAQEQWGVDACTQHNKQMSQEFSFTPLEDHNNNSSAMIDQSFRNNPCNNTSVVTFDQDIHEKLGEGANGCVYRATTKEGSTVAVKEFFFENGEVPPSLVEVNALRRLHHPHQVGFFGTTAATGQNVQYSRRIIMEYCNGVCLHKIRPLCESHARPIIGQVLLSVAYLHEQGYVHRDIKAANVFLHRATPTSPICVKLGDQGSTVPISSVPEPLNGVTMQWVAPELVQRGEVSSKNDVWALGCLLLELLTGKDPWSDTMRTSHEVLSHLRVCSEPPPTPQEASPGCKDFLAAAFKMDSSRRASAHDLLLHPWITQVSLVEGTKSKYACPGSVWERMKRNPVEKTPEDCLLSTLFNKREERVQELTFEDTSNHSEQDRVFSSAGTLTGHTVFDRKNASSWNSNPLLDSMNSFSELDSDHFFLPKGNDSDDDDELIIFGAIPDDEDPEHD